MKAKQKTHRIQNAADRRRVREYLDGEIKDWRSWADGLGVETAVVSALQEVRVALLGRRLGEKRTKVKR